MDKSMQSGRRDKKTAGTDDNWKEIKYNDPTPGSTAPKKQPRSLFDRLVGEIKYGGGYKGKGEVPR